MPHAPPTVCAHTGCGVVAYNGPRCPAHALETRRRWANPVHRDRGGTRQERGYGAAWVKLRAVVLRDEPLCRTCMAQGRVTAATQVDHVVSKSEGGTDARSNLAPTCTACHRAKTAREGLRRQVPL